jgi:hypothetical protein
MKKILFILFTALRYLVWELKKRFLDPNVIECGSS